MIAVTSATTPATTAMTVSLGSGTASTVSASSVQIEPAQLDQEPGKGDGARGVSELHPTLYAERPGRPRSVLFVRDCHLVFLAAGQEGFEPTTRGFGIRCSTNWSYWPGLLRFFVHRVPPAG